LKNINFYLVDPYEIQRFITMFTSTHHHTKCWNGYIQPYTISLTRAFVSSQMQMPTFL